jgi:hypothetical protein
MSAAFQITPSKRAGKPSGLQGPRSRFDFSTFGP